MTVSLLAGKHSQEAWQIVPVKSDIVQDAFAAAFGKPRLRRSSFGPCD